MSTLEQATFDPVARRESVLAALQATVQNNYDSSSVSRALKLPKVPAHIQVSASCEQLNH